MSFDLPGLRRLQNRGAYLSLEDGIEMAGPHQRFTDVDRRDRLGRRCAVPAIVEDAGLLGLDSAAQQHDQAAAGSAENTKKHKEGGQGHDPPGPSSGMSAEGPTGCLYQKRSARKPAGAASLAALLNFMAPRM